MSTQPPHLQTTTTATPISTAIVVADKKGGIRDLSVAAAALSNDEASYPCSVTTYEQVVQNVDLFNKTLKDLHESLGTKFMVPIIGGKALDLHLLFVEVTARGGLEKVIQTRKWREIIAVFSFPATITNASFVLRKYYMSLLHHYEQVYYFRKQPQQFSITYVGSSPVTESAPMQIEGARTNDNGTSSSQPVNPQKWPGQWVTGSIDGKFDNGYLVTVSFGSEQLKGVLYHVPHDAQVSRNTNSNNSSLVPRKRKRNRNRLAAMDPSYPKPKRSGYNFFFSEHYATLKAVHTEGEELTISTKMGNLWGKLSEAEKQVYRERGLRDKERFRKEMTEYRKTSNGSKLQ